MKFVQSRCGFVQSKDEVCTYVQSEYDVDTKLGHSMFIQRQSEM